MFKRLLLGIIVVVMTVVPAYSDMLPLDEEFFYLREEKLPPAASITLSPSEDMANTLVLTIKPEVWRGVYNCNIFEVSGDVRTHFISASVSCSRGINRHNITLPMPEEGKTSHYQLTVFFHPMTADKESVHFYREATVQNVDGKAYILIED